MSEDPKKRHDSVSLSVMEGLMFLTILVMVVGGLGLGTGFYLGSQVKNNQLNGVISLADDMSEAYQNERNAVRVNYDMLMFRVRKYEAWLANAGLEPTMPLVHASSSMAASNVKKTKGTARGGP